jgi:ribosome-associated translation inhibitor RaiA
MQVIFNCPDSDGRALRETAIHRLRFVMRRLAWLVPRARMQLQDVNGPRGGTDKRCRLELKTDSGETVVVTALAVDWRTAIESALARASRKLVQHWQRRLSQRRPGRQLRPALVMSQ